MRSMSGCRSPPRSACAPRPQSFMPLYSPVLWLAVTFKPPSQSVEPIAK
jgi:hypothetical protein